MSLVPAITVARAQCGDVNQALGLEDVGAALTPLVPFHLDAGGEFLSLPIVAAGFTQFRITSTTIPGGAFIDVSVVPLHPLTLQAFSDVLTNPFIIAIGTMFPGAGTISFGNNTGVPYTYLTTTAFKILLVEGAGMTYDATFGITMLAPLSRGVGLE